MRAGYRLSVYGRRGELLAREAAGKGLEEAVEAALAELRKAGREEAEEFPRLRIFTGECLPVPPPFLGLRRPEAVLEGPGGEEFLVRASGTVLRVVRLERRKGRWRYPVGFRPADEEARAGARVGAALPFLSSTRARAFDLLVEAALALARERKAARFTLALDRGERLALEPPNQVTRLVPLRQVEGRWLPPPGWATEANGGG